MEELNNGIGKIAIVKNNEFKETKSIFIDDIPTKKVDSALSIISLVQWHPSTFIFSVHLFRQNRVIFFTFDPNKTEGKVVQLGNAITTFPDPFVGRFIGDGDYYITADWGRNFKAKSVCNRLPEKNHS